MQRARHGALMGATLACIPFAASAQTTPPVQTQESTEASGGSQLEEIIVTAQKRSENLQDVPIAVTALSSSALESAGVSSIQNIQVAVPGVAFAQTAGYSLPRVRGVGTGAAGPGIENSVATYIDNVYIVSPFASMLSFNNIAQLAVLKGPQGTLFGRNATGGVIQISTLDPDEGTRLNASLTAANYGTFGGNVYAATGLGEAASAGVAGFYTNQTDGYGRNLVTGSEVGGYEAFGVRAKLKLQPTDSTVVRISGDYAKNEGDLFVFHIAKGTLPIGGVPYTGPDFSEALTIDNSQRIESGGVSLQIDQDIGRLRLVSITAYRRSLIDETFDSDAQPAPITAVSLKQKDRQFSQELQLLSPRTGGFTWMLGFFYFDATGRYPFSNIQSRAAPFLAPPTRINNAATQSTKSLAGFGQATVEISEATKLTAGLRYTSDERSFDNRRQITLPNGFALPASTASGEAKFNKLTWRLSLDHRFSEELLGYVSYNRGFKSGLFDPLTQPANLLRPEVLDAFEVGLKADLFDRTVRINAAAFHYDYQDIQISRVISGQIILQNGQGAKVDGLDLDLTARLSPRFTLTGGLSVLDHRFSAFPDAPRYTPLPTGGNAVSTGDAKGNRLPMVPVWTLNLGGTYTIPTSFGDLQLNGNYYHNDGYFEGPENRFRQAPFDLVNASIDWTSGRWRASIWGRNIFNQFYSTQLSAQARGDSVVVGDPRTYGVTLGVMF